MLIHDVSPVSSFVPLVIIPNEALLDIHIVCNVGAIDFDAEGAIRALDSCESVTEVELGNIAAWPCLLVRFRCQINVQTRDSLGVRDGPIRI